MPKSELKKQRNRLKVFNGLLTEGGLEEWTLWRSLLDKEIEQRATEFRAAINPPWLVAGGKE